jgi:DNA-binding protein YbaB
MLGDMKGMMAKLQEAQAKIEETKNRLNTIFVDGESGNEKVVVTVTANREVKNIAIDNELLNDKEELEDYLIGCIKRKMDEYGKNKLEVSFSMSRY